MDYNANKFIIVVVMGVVCVVLRECRHPALFLGGFHGNGSFCLGEDTEAEPEAQDDFLSFEADLVAEQLTYMDAVSEGAGGSGEGFFPSPRPC